MKEVNELIDKITETALEIILHRVFSNSSPSIFHYNCQSRKKQQQQQSSQQIWPRKLCFTRGLSKDWEFYSFFFFYPLEICFPAIVG